MNTKKIMIVLIIVLFFSVLLFVILFNKNKTAPTQFDQTNFQPTNSNTQNFPGTNINEIKLVSSVPKKDSKNIGLNQTITLIFNQNIQNNTININIDPPTAFKSNISNNRLLLTPIQSFQPGKLYLVYIKNPATNKYFDVVNFITIGQPAEITEKPEDFEYKNQQIAQLESINLQTQPDLYLFNLLPHRTNEYSISGKYDSSSEKYIFTIIHLSQNQELIKNKAIEWIKQQGLTDQQIQQLSISYQIYNQ